MLKINSDPQGKFDLKATAALNDQFRVKNLSSKKTSFYSIEIYTEKIKPNIIES